MSRQTTETPRAANEVLRELYESDGVTWEPRTAQVKVRTKLLSGRLPRATSTVVVDLGCGPGDNTQMMAEAIEHATFLGLDWSSRVLEQASSRGLATVASGLDPARLPFPDSSVDGLMLCEVIEHLVDTDRVLSEMHRVLKPGGAILVTTPNLAAWFNRLMLLAGVQPAFSEVSSKKIYGRPGKEVVGHLRLFTARALREFIADAGFVDVELAGVPFHDVPRLARPIDRVLARWPSVAAGLVAVATKPADS